jgi:hypothetical protein
MISNNSNTSGLASFRHKIEQVGRIKCLCLTAYDTKLTDITPLLQAEHQRYNIGDTGITIALDISRLSCFCGIGSKLTVLVPGNELIGTMNYTLYTFMQTNNLQAPLDDSIAFEIANLVFESALNLISSKQGRLH